VSGFVVLDVGQAIFAAALRTTGYVYTVMMTRILCFVCFYLPASIFIRSLSFENSNIKFLAFYGSFYFTISLIGLFFFLKMSKELSVVEKEQGDGVII
jgi:hypothetical protein